MFYHNPTVKTIAVILLLAVFIFFLYSSFTQKSFNHFIELLSEKSFPFEFLLLEGAPGLAQPELEYVRRVKNNAIGLGMYFLTGVNISDPRTYFLSFYAPPNEGLPWLGLAYHPDNPEMEGPILEPLDNPFYNEPAPVTSEDDVLVGIYHTHNAESYAGNGGKDRGIKGENGDIVEIGEHLAKVLNQKGVRSIHSAEIHDEVYIESYDHSYRTAKKMLEENPTIRLLIDIHRDGIPPEIGKSTVKINGVDVAKIMVVIGQKNPNWRKNTQIAEEIIRMANQVYPGLFFPNIRYASEARYNQHLTDGALLLEIGSQLNTKEEAQAAMEPLADVLKAYLEK